MNTTSRAGPAEQTVAGTRFRRRSPDRRDDRDAGMVTVEAALALCAFVTVVAMALAGISAVLDQIRCTDAAREAARLVARGEQDRAREAVDRIGPRGATLTVDTTGDTVMVVVATRAVGGLLPGIAIRAEAFAVREPDSARSTPPTDAVPPPTPLLPADPPPLVAQSAPATPAHPADGDGRRPTEGAGR